MNKIIINKNTFAISGKIPVPTVTMHYDPFELYGTPYGMLIPTSTSGYAVLRWVKKGMPEKDKNMVSTCDYVFISNDGEICIGYMDTIDNLICLIPYTVDNVTLITADRDINEAYTFMIGKRNMTLAEAAKFLEAKETTGFINPKFIQASEWVAYAKEKGYTENFFRTQF